MWLCQTHLFLVIKVSLRFCDHKKRCDSIHLKQPGLFEPGETTGNQSGMLTPRSIAMHHPSMVLKEDSMIKEQYTAPVYHCFWDKY